MERFKKANMASLFGIIGNIFLFIIKIIVGFISHSQSMIADAFNSASDILSSIMTYVGNKIAAKGADDDHNLGHGKAEYIYSMLISITMIALGIKIFSASFMSILNPSKFIFSWWLIVVCFITIVVKFILFIYTNNIGKKYNNLLVSANSKDHRNDMLLTICNLIAIVCSYFGLFIVDGVVGILISLWIVISGFKIFKDSYDVLMDKSVSLETKEKVLSIIDKYDEIIKINHFNSTPVGYQYQVSFSIFVDGNMSTFESHDIANKLEKEIIRDVDEIYLVIIHVNPYNKKKI